MRGVPKRFDLTDIEGIHSGLSTDGAVILTTSLTSSSEEMDWQMFAGTLSRRVFGSKLKVEPKVAGVHLEHRELESITKAKGFSYSNSALLPHTDGYIYGDNYPDYVLLLVEAQAERGGQSYVVDGEHVLQQLNPKDIQLLQERTVDLTERAQEGIADGVESFGPVIQRTGSNQRLRWRRQVTVEAGKRLSQGKTLFKSEECRDNVEPIAEPYQSLWKPLTNDPIETQVLQKLDRIVQAEAKAAKRFTVKRGEALLIDNFRTLHAREGYSGNTERKLWRVWVSNKTDTYSTFKLCCSLLVS